MPDKKYVDSSNLGRAVDHIKTLLNNKVSVEQGKGLSSNDYTTEEKTKLAGLENYTLEAASAQTLGGVKVGAGLTINNEGILSATGGGTADAVDWENIQGVPQTLVYTSDIENFVTNDDLAAVEGKLTGVYHFKGSVANMTALLAVEDPEEGDVYNIEDTGMNAAWDGEAWDEFGTTVDFNNIATMSDAEVDALFE